MKLFDQLVSLFSAVAMPPGPNLLVRQETAERNIMSHPHHHTQETRDRGHGKISSDEGMVVVICGDGLAHETFNDLPHTMTSEQLSPPSLCQPAWETGIASACLNSS